MRESGKCVEGCACKGKEAKKFAETCRNVDLSLICVDSRHRPVLGINGVSPVLDPTVFVATSASIVGNVQIATGSGVWYGSVIRGDNNSVTIGTESHIQDRAIVSGVASTESGLPGSVYIGNNVVVGRLSGVSLSS